MNFSIAAQHRNVNSHVHTKQVSQGLIYQLAYPAAYPVSVLAIAALICLRSGIQFYEEDEEEFPIRLDRTIDECNGESLITSPIPT